MAMFLTEPLQDERDEPIKDGGVIVSFHSDILTVKASRYDSGGADSTMMLEEIRKVRKDVPVTTFRAVVHLQGIWWSKDRRESSEHCMRVISEVFKLGCVGLQDVLDLPRNDLDDTFLEECFGLFENQVCSLDYINLNDNRITTEGALWLIRALQKRRNIDHRLPELLLHRNPIDDCRKVEQAARDAGVQCEVGTAWTLENGKTALTSRDLWSEYFAGPAQLLRTIILEQMERMPLAECPICHCILTHDPRRTHSTMHNRLCSHLRGDRHRKNLSRFESDDDLPLILIVSPTVSFTLHPLTGEVRSFEKSSHALVAMPEPEADAYTVELRPDAPDPKHLQVVSSEGRASLAMLEPELVYEILSEFSNECRDATSASQPRQAQEFSWPQPAKYQRMTLRVMDVHYTQKAISKRFQDGSWLEHLIWDLDMWNVDPCNHPNMCLEVVKYQEHFYSNDNRRLLCLRKHQEKWEETGWQVWVHARVFNFEDRPERVIDRFLNRMRERWEEGTAAGEIWVRR